MYHEELAKAIDDSINEAIRNEDTSAIGGLFNVIEQYYNFLKEVYDTAEEGEIYDPTKQDENLIALLKARIAGGGYLG